MLQPFGTPQGTDDPDTILVRGGVDHREENDVGTRNGFLMLYIDHQIWYVYPSNMLNDKLAL